MSKRKKLNTFTQTSDQPYTRHYYRLHLHNSNPLTFTDYEQLQAAWYILPNTNYVEILDI